MRPSKWKRFKLQRVNIHEISDRILLANLYLTQGLILLLASLLMWWKDISLWQLLKPFPHAGATIVTYGILCAAFVLLVDVTLTRFVPEHVTDDGGVNEKIFAGRPIWHIAVICLVVAICEELLFRGAIQYMIGAYWTSIVFAVIHVRYLRHWLMTSIVFAISYALGWIYMQTGTIITPIIAHFAIDFVLGVYLRGRANERT